VAIFNRGIESATRIVADNSAEVVLLGVQHGSPGGRFCLGASARSTVIYLM